MKKIIKKIVLLVIIIALGFLVMNMFKKPPKTAIPPRPVETAVAVQKDVPIYIESFGNLYSPNDVQIKSRISGQITEEKFKEGSEVKKGDLLVVIDPRPYKVALDKAKALLAQDSADLKLKKDTFERNKVLFEKQLISQQDFDRFETDFLSAQAKVQLDQAGVDEAALNLEYCYIRSPINGLAGKTQADLGNMIVAIQETVLVNIKEVDNLYVDFTIPETRLQDVRQAMSADKLQVEVSIENDKNGPYKGQLEMIENTVDNTTGTVLLRAVVPNANRALWPGQFVKVRLILGIEQNAVLVPYKAVQIGQKGDYLFVVSPDNKADLRMVLAGSRQEDHIVIKKGVQPGEKVVVAGYLALSPQADVIDITEQEAMMMQKQGMKE